MSDAFYQVLSSRLPFHQYKTPYLVGEAIVDKRELPETKPTHSPENKSYGPIWNVAMCCWKRDPTERLSMEENHRRLRLTLELSHNEVAQVAPSTAAIRK